MTPLLNVTKLRHSHNLSPGIVTDIDHKAKNCWCYFRKGGESVCTECTLSPENSVIITDVLCFQQECFMTTGTHWEECYITKKERCLLGNLSFKNLRSLSASLITKIQGCGSYILYKYTFISTLNTHTMTLHELSIRAEWNTGRVE